MKMKHLLLLSMLMFAGCIKLAYDGGTFLTVKGRITDSTNNGIPNFGLSVYNTGPNLGSAVSANGVTDANGYFQITFPSSNGLDYLELQNGYIVFDSSGILPLYGSEVPIDTAAFKNYLNTMAPIKVIKQ